VGGGGRCKLVRKAEEKYGESGAKEERREGGREKGYEKREGVGRGAINGGGALVWWREGGREWGAGGGVEGVGDG